MNGSYKRRTARQLRIVPRRQSGMALLAFVLILVTSASFMLLSRLNAATQQAYREEQTALALREAKEALIGWATGHPNAPGMLPWPDRNGDDDYDGNSDCATISFADSMFIGRLPWLGQSEIPCETPYSNLSLGAVDSAGERLWYAVSKNLVRNYQASQYPIVHSDIGNSATYPWLTVRDQSGAVISNRVAFIVMAPGAVLEGQNRGAVAPNITNYLDSVTIGGITYSNANADQDFIAYPNSDLTTDPNDQFNDVLLYVTIDELMPSIEMRVARDAKSCLDSYAASSGGKYPFAEAVASPPPTCSDATFGRVAATPDISVSTTCVDVPDGSMQPAWPTACVFAKAYWANWSNFVFYQVATDYKPNPGVPAPANCVSPCLGINGAGSYRAVVGIARTTLTGQDRTNPNLDPPANFLEGLNPHSEPAPVTAFESHNRFETAFQTVNDLFLCIDGGAICQ